MLTPIISLEVPVKFIDLDIKWYMTAQFKKMYWFQCLAGDPISMFIENHGMYGYIQEV